MPREQGRRASWTGERDGEVAGGWGGDWADGDGIYISCAMAGVGLEVAPQGGGWRGRGRRRSEATQRTTGRWLVAVGPDGRTDGRGRK